MLDYWIQSVISYLRIKFKYGRCVLIEGSILHIMIRFLYFHSLFPKYFKFLQFGFDFLNCSRSWQKAVFEDCVALFHWILWRLASAAATVCHAGCEEFVFHFNPLSVVRTSHNSTLRSETSREVWILKIITSIRASHRIAYQSLPSQ